MSSTAAKTVFIVEDETPLAEVLEEYLRASAMDVERIEDGTAVWCRGCARPRPTSSCWI